MDACEATAVEGTVCGEEECDDGSEVEGRRAATLAGIPLNMLPFGVSFNKGHLPKRIESVF